MAGYVLGIAIILLLCIIAEKFSDRFGMPALILFMFIGMVFGCDGIFKISFDDFTLAETVCSLALVFIMFYGGFSTKWSAAEPVAGRAISLATLGVVITAGITTVLCHMLLKMSLEESFLVGAVLSSTDAASVFSILRKKKLNLKYGTASILEVESGSNDPIAYMLTIIAISILKASDSGNVVWMVLLQIIIGILAGCVVSVISIQITTKTKIVSEGLDTIFMIAMVLSCYSLSTILQGNAYLSLYLYGIIVGNSRINNKQTGDTVILSVPPYVPSEDEKLEEIVIDQSHKWCGKEIGELELKEHELIALILRDNETIIPDGKTTIIERDKVVLYR